MTHNVGNWREIHNLNQDGRSPRKMTRKKQKDIFDELTGGGTMAGIMGLMMVAGMRPGTMLPRISSVDKEKPRD